MKQPYSYESPRDIYTNSKLQHIPSPLTFPLNILNEGTLVQSLVVSLHEEEQPFLAILAVSISTHVKGHMTGC